MARAHDGGGRRRRGRARRRPSRTTFGPSCSATSCPAAEQLRNDTGLPDLLVAPQLRRMPAISVRDLRKDYGDIHAVDGVSFDVDEGEVYALLGHNGAGKSTTVEILEGHRKRSAGEVTVLGHDPARPAADFRDRIGIVLQSSGVEHELTVAEAVEVYGSCYRAARDRRRGRRARRPRPSSSTAASGTCRAGSAGGSTWRWASSDGPTCCSSTSRRRASIRRPAARPGS